MMTGFIWIFGVFQFLSLSSRALSPSETVVNFADVPCGRVPRSLVGLSRRSKIVGGSTVLPGEFPWTASIQDERDIHFCGGFAISKRIVVSAAHCFIHYMHGLITEDGLQSMKVVVGANDLKSPKTSFQSLRIRRVNLHPKFSYMYPDFENDIALIEVDRDIEWSTNVQPVCLSTYGEDENISARDGDEVEGSVVAGWGVHVEDQLDEEWMKEMKLQKVDLPLWSNINCQKAYLKHGIDWRTKQSHICAGYIDGKRDTCRGDSGSALVVKHPKNDTWIARGLVSAGEGCARPGIPGIYTRMSHFLPYILSVISTSS